MTENKYGQNGSNVIELTTRDFNGATLIHPKFKGKGMFAVVKAYAPWCPHCTAMISDMEFLAKNLEGEICFFGLNCDNPINREMGEKLNVSGFPTLFFSNLEGELSEMNLPGRTPLDILESVCQHSTDYVSKNKKGVSKCCKIHNGKIMC